MPHSFSVSFSCKKRLKVDDVIDFEQKQIDEIKEIAKEYTLFVLKRSEKEGKKISYLTPDQENKVIDTKNTLTIGKTAEELLDGDYVDVGIHSNDRLLERKGSNNREDVIHLTNSMMATDTVLKAQFKGYPGLSYTTINSQDPLEEKIPISFLKSHQPKNVIIIKIVTMIPKDAPPKKMEQGIGDKYAAMMEEFKKRLK